MKIAFSLMLFVTLGACATGSAPPMGFANNLMPVEIVTEGDDGLTQRLADAVRAEFQKSAAFALAPAPTISVLTVTIPTHVGWQQVGGKTRVTYRLRLERAGQMLGASGGGCWENDLRVCAQGILSAAGRATKL